VNRAPREADAAAEVSASREKGKYTGVGVPCVFEVQLRWRPRASSVRQLASRLISAGFLTVLAMLGK